jgi:hypothetical protein
MFPAITIPDEDGREQVYWDGGLVSNTPLMDLQDELRAGDERGTFVFDVHIFERKGAKPRSIDDVFWRQKSIQFGSRKRQAAEIIAKHEAEAQAGSGPKTRFEVCQIMYEQDPESPEFWFSDGDLSSAAFDALFAQGRCDTQAAFEAVPVVIDGEYGALYRIGSLRKPEPDTPRPSYPSSPVTSS